MKKLMLILILPFGACLAAENVHTNANQTSASSMIGGSAFTMDKKGGDLSQHFGKAAKRNKQAEVAVHAPEDPYLSVNGELVTWGEVDTHIDLLMLNSPLHIPPEATADEVQQIIANTRAKYAEKLASVYVRNALFAQLARKEGITISSNELALAIADSMSKLPANKRHKISDGVRVKDTFFKRDLENYQLTLKYRQQILSTNIVVSAEEIAAAKRLREVEIRDAIATNLTLRPRMEGWLKEIRAGKRDFAQTAFDFSDCGSAADEGDMGEFDRDCVLLDPLKNFVFSSSTNTLSDVLETPYSYNIVKIIERTYDQDDDTPEIPVSAHIAQIMLEKVPVLDPLDDDSARKLVFSKKLGAATVELQRIQLKAAKIQSAVKVKILDKKRPSAK